MAIGPVLAAAWLHGDLYPSHLSFSVTRHRKEGVERREVRDVFLFLCLAVFFWPNTFSLTILIPVRQQGRVVPLFNFSFYINL